MQAEPKMKTMNKHSIVMLRKLNGGGKSLIFTLLSLPFLTLTACSEDSPASIEPQNFIETRSAADSTVVGDSSAVPSVQLQVDTAWAGQKTYDFDGKLVTPNTEGEATTGDAADAARLEMKFEKK